MWNKLTQAAGLGASASNPTVEDSPTGTFSEAQEQINQQSAEINQLKELMRENERLFQEKSKELEETTSKFQKFKLQSKAKICQLNNQLKELEKTTKKDDADFEDTSSSDSSDQSKRGKVIMFKKQLEQAKQQIEKKEKAIEEMNKNYESLVSDLHTQLKEKDEVLQSLRNPDTGQLSVTDEPKSVSQDGTNIHEMYAQIVYKDSKIMELNNHILDYEGKIMDLQEHIKEKEEVLQSRNRAIQLMTEDMSRKGKSVVDELDEVRGQMRIMQENFSLAEVQWKAEKCDLDQEINVLKEKFVQDIAERDNKIKSSQEALKKSEVVRYDLATKNAELQTKLVMVQENADKQCEAFRSQLEEELQNLRSNVEQEKAYSSDLQKALDEVTSHTDAKVLKARVKERTKFKALERELAALKKGSEGTPDKVTQLHQHIAELEEEKGSLQLKLIEVEEQIVLQEQFKSKKDFLQSSLEELKEKFAHAEMLASKLGKENSDLQSQLDDMRSHCEQSKLLLEEEVKKNALLNAQLEELNHSKEQLENIKLQSESTIEKLVEENKDLSDSITLVKEEKVSLEMKVIELEEVREGDEHVKQDLLYQINKLQDSLSLEKEPIVQLDKENKELREKISQLEKLHNSDQEQLHNTLHESNCFQKELKELQNQYASIVDQSENLRLENEQLFSALKDKEKMVEKLRASEETLNMNNSEKQLEVTTLVEKCDSLQVALGNLFSLFCVNDLDELRNKYLDTVDNVKKLSGAVLGKDSEIEKYRLEYKTMVDKAEKLQLDCQARNSELQSCFELIQNLKMHINDQDRSYKDEVNKLNEIIKKQDKEKSDLSGVVYEKEELLQKTSAVVEEKEKVIQDLNESVEQQSNIICQLEEQNTLSASEIQRLNGAREEAADKTQSKMSSLLEQITDLEGEVSKLQAEICVKQQSCDDLEETDSYLKAQLEDLLERQKSHDIVCKNLKEMCEELQQQIAVFENERAKKSLELKTLKGEYEAEKCAISKISQDSINSLELSLSKIQAEKTELLRVNMVQESEINKLQENVNEFKQQLQLVTDNWTQVSRNWNSANEKNLSLGNQLQEAQNQIQTLEMKVSDLNSSILEREEMNKKLQSDNLSLRSDSERLLSMSIEANQKNEILTKENNDILNKLGLAQNEFLTVSSALRESNWEKENLAESLAENVKNVESNESEIKILEARYSTLSNENKLLREEMSDLVALIEKQKQEINEMETTLQQKLKEHSESLCQMELQKHGMAKGIPSSETALQMVQEAKKSSLEEGRYQEVDYQGRENIALEAESNVLDYSSKLNNLISDINSCKHELDCEKAKNAEYESKLEAETEAKFYLQEKLSRFDATGEYLRNALQSAFQEKNLLKTSLLSLKSEAEMQLNQYATDLVHLQEALNVVNHGFQQKEAELLLLLKNSAAENAALREANDDLSERLKDSNTRMQPLIEERNALQGLMLELRQKVDDLKEKLTLEECQHRSLFEARTEQLTSLENQVEFLTGFNIQYLSIANKLRSLEKCVSDQGKKNLINEGLDLVFPRDFHLVGGIITSIENMFLDYKHKNASLHLTINQMHDEKESLIRSSQTVQDDNSSLLSRLSHLEEGRDTLVSLIPVVTSEVSSITTMHDKTLTAVLENINSKDLRLKNMETSFPVLKQKFSALEKQMKVLNCKNSAMKHKIQSGREELLQLQKFNRDLLEEKSKSKERYEAKEVQLERLTECVLLLQPLGNWVNDRTETIGHLIEHLQTPPKKDVSLPPELNTNRYEKEKADKEKSLEFKSPMVELVGHHDLQCKDCISSNQQLHLAEEKINELIANSHLKDITVNELLEEQKRNENVIANLISVFKDLEDSVNKVQSQIEKAADTGNCSSEHACCIELSVEASESLLKEVEHLYSRFRTAEKEKLALQEQVQIVTHQMQYIETDSQEKIESLKAEVNEVTRSNKKLIEELAEASAVLLNKEVEYANMQQPRPAGEIEKRYHHAEQEIGFLISELEKIREDKTNDCQKSIELERNVELLLKDNSKMKMQLNELCYVICDKMNHNLNLFAELDYPVAVDESTFSSVEGAIAFLKNNINLTMMSLSEKQIEIKALLSKLKQRDAEKDGIADALKEKTHLCDELNAKVEELKKSLTAAQGEPTLNEGSGELELCAVKSPELFSEVSKVNYSTEELQKQSAKSHSSNLVGSNNVIESLQHQLGIQKLKYDKMLAKLKVSRDQVEELQITNKWLTRSVEELAALRDEAMRFQKQQLELNEKLQNEWKTSERENKIEIRNLNDRITELRERNAMESSMGDKLRIELQQYKELWEQCNSTFELQKEDNEKLHRELKSSVDELENVKSKVTDLTNRCLANDSEKKHLQNVIEGLKENVNMLISDNDTFQELIEKLSQSKAALEKDVLKLKDRNPREISQLNKKFQSEIRELTSQLQTAEEQNIILSNIERSYKELENKYSLSEEKNRCLENNIHSVLKEKTLLENKSKDLYNEFCRQADELHRLRMISNQDIDLPNEESEENKICDVQGGVSLHSMPAQSQLSQNSTSHLPSSSTVPGESVKVRDLEKQINEVCKEKQALELHIKYLTDELQSAMLQKEVALEESVAKEKQWRNDTMKNELLLQQQITHLQIQLATTTNQADLGGRNLSELVSKESYRLLETELEQAMNNLHRQGLRCEELSLEVSKLLEERNDLRLKLNQHHQQDMLSRSELVSKGSSLTFCDEVSPVKIGVPSGEPYAKAVINSGYVQPSDPQAEIIVLLERLQECEKTCTELRKSNEALDVALTSEQEQRKLLEDELGFAKEHLTKNVKASPDEYQILLDDFDESQAFLETDFTITRRVKSNAQMLHRWVRGRRNYLCRAIRSKNYFQLLYLVYLFAIHVWVVMCTFGHS